MLTLEHSETDYLNLMANTKPSGRRARDGQPYAAFWSIPGGYTPMLRPGLKNCTTYYELLLKAYRLVGVSLGCHKCVLVLCLRSPADKAAEDTSSWPAVWTSPRSVEQQFKCKEQRQFEPNAPEPTW